MTFKPVLQSIGVGIVIFAGMLCAQEAKDKLEGWKPYTPSKLEWLSVDLNSRMRADITVDSQFMLCFLPIEKEDTIVIYVKYLPSVNRASMNIAINGAREVIAIEAKSKGWSSWLKVREKIEMVNGR
jgi:hypothetical protein